ncbi:nuclear transport factor 2 family protein [Micromonospora humi]|uniref:SnoaL-like domain-containing protein n=1 Tax=Micromonospora humi TaxID=745366 RepID=A0A1C5GYS8_9ACTN|nr:nuclear transport factor 2 family protein [Micromonospora humi]SCG38969.1 SnoaL-like domain-containing protein [Micromonospora humi]
MNATDWNQASPIAPDELPATITRYLTAHQARDLDAAVALLTPDAAVTDEGRTHQGPEQIRAWLSRSTGEYTYTTALTAAAKTDDQHYDAVHHLEGDFPGGTADLHFRFTLRNGLIARLVIEP